MGFSTTIIVRSLAELEKIYPQNPFLNQPEKDLKWVVILFLTGTPETTAWEELCKAYKGPEELYLRGQEIFIYYTNDIGHSKLTNAYIEKKLKVSGTGRNWNTFIKILEMSRG